MPKLLEIDEDTWNQREQLFKVASTIYANPKARVLLEQAQKLVNPNAPTPAIDEMTARNEPIEATLAELADIKKQLQDERDNREREQKLASIKDMQNRGFAALRQQHFTNDGITAIEKIMEEKGILDPLDAAAIFEKHNPPAAVATPGGTGGWNFMEGLTDTDGDLKRLIETKGESEPLLNKMVNETLNEMRGVVRR